MQRPVQHVVVGVADDPDPSEGKAKYRLHQQQGPTLFFGRPTKGSANLAVGCVGLVALFGIMSVRTVEPATVGVVTTFGRVSASTLTSGLHLVNPFASVVSYSTKTQLFEQQNHVPTKEGLTVDLDVALLYHIDEARVRDIYLSLGPDYVSVLLMPELSSAVRGLTSEADAKALYTSGRSEMQKKLKAELSGVLEPRGILLEDVLLKAVTLPALLSHSIELKAQAEQESARMEFVLTKERQEATRKGVEAKGIADFQKIVSEGISPALLQWKGIEATEKLASAPNAKVRDGAGPIPRPRSADSLSGLPQRTPSADSLSGLPQRTPAADSRSGRSHAWPALESSFEVATPAPPELPPTRPASGGHHG